MTTAFAQDNNEKLLSKEQNSNLIKVLNFVETQKSDFNLQEVDFNYLQIGEKLSTYTLNGATVSESVSTYPLFYRNELVAFATELKDGENSDFQISTLLAQKINNLITDKDDIAMLYSGGSAYLYRNNDIIKIIDSQYDTSEKIDISAVNTSKIITTNCSPKDLVGYFKLSNLARAETYYSCNVGYVSQATSNICWAATIAMIVNYKKGTSYSSLDVERYCAGGNYNSGKSLSESQTALNKYGLYYSLSSSNLKNLVSGSLSKNYPVFGCFKTTVNPPSYGSNITYGPSKHACCVYSINIVYDYIGVKDPYYGTFTASPNSTYGGYMYLASGTYLVLDSILYKS